MGRAEISRGGLLVAKSDIHNARQHIRKGPDKSPGRGRGLQVLGERKPRSVFGNDGGAAPVEAVIDPALHHVETVTIAYERTAEDATGFNATDPNGFTEIEFDVVVLDLRRPTRREAPFDAGPDDPTEALATGKGRVKKGPIRQKADAGRTGFGEGSAALHIEKPIICRIAQTTREQGKILESPGGGARESCETPRHGTDRGLGPTYVRPIKVAL